jgi:hypothetical protein
MDGNSRSRFFTDAAEKGHPAVKLPEPATDGRRQAYDGSMEEKPTHR